MREARDEFVAGDDGTARGQDAAGLGVALRIRQRRDHVAHDDVGGLEAERCRVADVELEDAVTLGLEPGGVGVYRAADLVEHVAKLGGLLEHAGLGTLVAGHGCEDRVQLRGVLLLGTHAVHRATGCPVDFRYLLMGQLLGRHDAAPHGLRTGVADAVDLHATGDADDDREHGDADE